MSHSPDPMIRKQYWHNHWFKVKNRELKRQRENYTIMVFNGKRKKIKVLKRRYEDRCEICGKKIERKPEWHHWNDLHPELGLWVCWDCHHWVCEAFEHDPASIRRNKYLEMKRKIEGSK